MPSSFSNFDSVVKELIQIIHPTSFLDIGCGAGKYGKLVKSIHNNCHTTGIEIEESYRLQFDIDNIYNDILIGDAWNIISKDYSKYYDLCIIGDCIEHMKKSTGIDLVNFLVYRTQYIILLIPEFIVQDSVNGIDSESHVSVWNETDFLWHDRWAWDNAYTISIFVLRGYQPSSINFDDLIDSVNERKVFINDFYSERILRPVNLIKKVKARDDLMDGVRVSFRPQ